MATLSNNDIARAIYLASKDKTDVELKDVSARVVKFLAKRRLLSKSKNILEKLDKIINKENERLEVKVSSARALEEESKMELAEFLKKRYKVKAISFKETIDSRVLGGIKIEVNDEVIDLTAKNKFKKLQEHLTRKI